MNYKLTHIVSTHKDAGKLRPPIIGYIIEDENSIVQKLSIKKSIEFVRDCRIAGDTINARVLQRSVPTKGIISYIIASGNLKTIHDLPIAFAFDSHDKDLEDIYIEYRKNLKVHPKEGREILVNSDSIPKNHTGKSIFRSTQLSQAMKGVRDSSYKVSEETRHRMSIAKLGKPVFVSEETRKKRSLAKIGTTIPDEVRKKMSISQKKRHALRKQLLNKI